MFLVIRTVHYSSNLWRILKTVDEVMVGHWLVFT